MIIGLHDFIAGWIAGTAALAIGHPFDTVKVRQQVLQVSFLRAVTFTFRHEGIRGFYKGFVFPWLMVGPSNAIFFGIYGGTMEFIAPDNATGRVHYDDPNWQRNVFWAGTNAGFWQVLFTCPSEVIKTMLQMQTENKSVWNSKYETNARGLIDCIRKIWQLKGFKWYFRGITPMMYRDCPASGVYVWSYEVLLQYDYGYDLLNASLVRQSIAGGTAGVVSWIIVIPFDVVKSRMQGDDMLNPRFKSTWDCIKVTYKQCGWRYFFQGSLPVIIRAFPFNVTIFVTYENAMKLFQTYG